MQTSASHPTEVGEPPHSTFVPTGSVSLLCERMHQWCGVHLGPDKSYLLANRLRNLMLEYSVSTYDDLVEIADGARDSKLRDRIVDSLTTHETLFFRDRSSFDALKQILLSGPPRTGTRRVRIWSAACSSGQEPYSIAMTLLDSIPNIRSWDISIFATDVSPGTIAHAKKGVYREHEVRRGVSDEQRDRFFLNDGDLWRVTDEVRRMVTFQVGDLTSHLLPAGPFDLIFCRNVLIYFRPEVAQRVLSNVISRLSKDGRLFVGGSELIPRSDGKLAAETQGAATCYRLK